MNVLTEAEGDPEPGWTGPGWEEARAIASCALWLQELLSSVQALGPLFESCQPAWPGVAARLPCPVQSLTGGRTPPARSLALPTPQPVSWMSGWSWLEPEASRCT